MRFGSSTQGSRPQDSTPGAADYNVKVRSHRVAGLMPLRLWQQPGQGDALRLQHAGQQAAGQYTWGCRLQRQGAQPLLCLACCLCAQGLGSSQGRAVHFGSSMQASRLLESTLGAAGYNVNVCFEFCACESSCPPSPSDPGHRSLQLAPACSTQAGTAAQLLSDLVRASDQAENFCRRTPSCHSGTQWGGQQPHPALA